MPFAVIPAIFAWFMLPGVLTARWIAERDRLSVPTRVFAGLWGYATSSVWLLALWVAGIHAPAALLGAPPVLAWVTLRIVGPRVGPIALPAPVRRDAPMLLLVLLCVPLVVGVPFSRVGALTPEGRTYRAYFTADFVWRMAVTAEVAKGDVPPQNQYLRGDDLRYYWLPDLLPAVEYRSLGRAARLEHVLLLNAFCVDLLFLAAVYAFARVFVASAGAAALGVIFTLFCSSFEGLERLVVLWRRGVPFDELRVLNIDAVTRWFYGSLPVDGLQRVLFYQPQHATAYALVFAALGCLVVTARAPRVGAAALAGLSIGFAMLFSSFTALMMVPIAGLFGLAAFVAARRWKDLFLSTLVFLAPVAAAAGVALALHYVDRSGSVVRLLVNPMAIRHPYAAIALSFGPVLLPVALGLWTLARRDRWHAAALLGTMAVAFWFYFFVDVRDHQYVYVGWRAGHFVFIAAAALAAAAVVGLRGAGRRLRFAAAGVWILIAVAAVPTVAIDIYNTQDTANRAAGPGFRWTLVLSPAELEAFDWIRRFTPPDAVVQVEPHVRQNHTWAYIPAFAERRMAAGIPISMVPLAKYLAASEQVRALYGADSAADAHARARALAIDYLVVAPPERAAFPSLEARLDARPDLFRPVFRNAEVTIYFVERAPVVLP